jgi:hypothetical protein
MRRGRHVLLLLGSRWGYAEMSHARPLGAQGGDPVAYQEQQSQRHGVGGWSRSRWLIVALVMLAIAAGIVLIVLYTGGGGSGGGGGGGY